LEQTIAELERENQRLRQQIRYPDAKDRDAVEKGLQFQDWVCCLFKERYNFPIQNMCSRRYQLALGENLQGWEIKLDDLCLQYGRLSIEIAERRHKHMPSWTPSGIFAEPGSTFYAQGNAQFVAVFSTRWLRGYFATAQPEVFTKRDTVQAFYMDLSLAQECAEMIADLRDEPFNPFAPGTLEKLRE
jgi:hypothetical protein